MLMSLMMILCNILACLIFPFLFVSFCKGLYCSLRQLLEVGFFHADPHPGNLVATYCGALAYFDFGMMGDIPRHFRVGLIQMVKTSRPILNRGHLA